MWSYTWFCLVMVGQVMCGVKIPIPSPGSTSIIGGEETPERKFPYRVFILHSQGQIYTASCGGCIISKDYIVTAAHCVDDKDPSTTSVRFGNIFRFNGTEVKVEKVVRHPDYKTGYPDNDIAILKTTYEIEFNDNVKAIALPSKGRTVEGEIIVTGWELVPFREAHFIPRNLMYLNVSVLDHGKCENQYGRLTENMLCIGAPKPCLADSGEPATQDDLLVGIVSVGELCDVTGKLSVYANVASPSIRDFITEITGL